MIALLRYCTLQTRMQKLYFEFKFELHFWSFDVVLKCKVSQQGTKELGCSIITRSSKLTSDTIGNIYFVA